MLQGQALGSTYAKHLAAPRCLVPVGTAHIEEGGAHTRGGAPKKEGVAPKEGHRNEGEGRAHTGGGAPRKGGVKPAHTEDNDIVGAEAHTEQ